MFLKGIYIDLTPKTSPDFPPQKLHSWVPFSQNILTQTRGLKNCQRSVYFCTILTPLLPEKSAGFLSSGRRTSAYVGFSLWWLAQGTSHSRHLGLPCATEQVAPSPTRLQGPPASQGHPLEAEGGASAICHL